MAEMSSTLNKYIADICEDIEQEISCAASYNTPTSDLEKGLEIIKLIPMLFDKIQHGEIGHRQWLEEAIKAHFMGLPFPAYVK